MTDIIVTGLSRKICNTYFGHTNAVRYVPVDELLNSSNRNKTERVIGLYRAPWVAPREIDVESAVIEASAVLDGWLEAHRHLLRKRRALGSRLLLVNIDCVDFVALLSFLGLEPDERAGNFCGDNCCSKNEFAVNALIANIFESAAPEYWDVFEALETLAWRPEAELVATDQLNVPSIAAVQNLYQMLLDCRLVPGLKGDLASVNIQHNQSEAKAVDLENQLITLRKSVATERLLQEQADIEAEEIAKKNQNAFNENRQRSDLLQQQLHQVQEELEKLKDEIKQQTQKAAVDTVTLDELRAAEKNTSLELGKLNQELTAAKAEKEKLGSELKNSQKTVQTMQILTEEHQVSMAAVQSENGELLQQLHQVQEELEKIYLDNQTKSVASHEEKAKLTVELEKLKDEIKQQTHKAAADTVTLDELRAAEKNTSLELGKLNQELTAAKAEKEKLGSELKNSQKTVQTMQILTEEHQVSMAAVQSENGELLQQLHQAQQEVEKIFLDGQAQVALVEKQKSEAFAQLNNLNAELNQQIKKSMADAAEIGKMQSAEKVANAELAKLKQDLLVIQTEHQKISSALQEKTGEAQAAQQITDQQQEQVKELQGENELCLQQMHQVQNELERYFLENRILQESLGQSRVSLDRARRLISQLVSSEVEKNTSPVSGSKVLMAA